MKLALFCITGMHRSGTSLVARVAHSLGVDLGPAAALMTPKPDNPEGFWENREITALHDDLLASLGGRWDEPPLLAPGWENDSALENLYSCAERILRATFPPEATIAAWKDPRGSLLFPFWKRVTELSGVVLVVRDPREVAASLAARDGFEPAKSATLFTRYVASAWTAPGARFVVDYSELMDSSREVSTRLAEFLRLPAPALADLDRVAGVCNRALRHHVVRTEELAVETPEMREALLLYRLIRDQDCSAVDVLTSSLVRNWELRATAARTDCSISQLRDRVMQEAQRADRATEQAKELDSRIRCSDSTIEGLQKQLEERTSWAQRLDSERGALEAEIERLQGEVAQLSSWARALDRGNQELRAQAARLQECVDERSRWAQRLDQENHELCTEVRRLQLAEERTDWAQRLDREHQSLKKLAHEWQTSLEESAKRASSSERDYAVSRSAVEGLRAPVVSPQESPEIPGRPVPRLEAASTPAPHEEDSVTGTHAQVIAGREATEPATDLPPAGVRGERPRVLFVQSGGAASASRALAVLEAKLAPNARLTYVSYPRALLPSDSHFSSDTEHVEVDVGALDLLRLRVRLGRRHHDLSTVLFSGEPGHRRLKLLGISLAFRRLLIFNENGDCFRIAPAPLWRHARWRVLGRLEAARPLHLLLALVSLARIQGVGAAVRKVRERRAVVHRYSTAARLTRRKLHPKLPLHNRPRVSIVIPVFNQWRHTVNCLHSIGQHAGSVPFEVIVVDNASTDRTARGLARIENLRVVRMPSNVGFLKACNCGLEVARGEYVLFLNNDTIVTEGWLAALLRVIDGHRDCGAVGPKLLFPNGLLQEAGGIVWRDGTAWNYGRFDDAEKPEYNYVREVDYVSGAALLVRADIVRPRGGFDPAYAPGYWEDTDLCFWLRTRGFKVMYQPQSRVFHFEGASAGRDTRKNMKRYQHVNAPTFRTRWGEALAAQHACDPQALFRARDRHPGPVVLVVDHYVPTPDRDAGSFFLHTLLRALRDLSCRIVLWPDNLYRSPGYTEDLQQRGIEVIYGNVRFDQYIESVGRCFDLALVHRSEIAAKYLPSLRSQIPRVVYMAADLAHLREARRWEAHGRQGETLAPTLEAREWALIGGVVRTTVHSPLERDLILEKNPGVPVSVLPLPVREPARPGPSFEKRTGLLFVGSTHPPNVDALDWLLSAVMPHVRSLLPSTDLVIAGEAGLRLGKHLRHPDVHVAGHQPSLDAFYERARVYVVPLRYGAGIKGKVLEAMSLGVPIVTTSIGAEGIGIRDGVHALIADSAESFAAAIVRLYSDSALWRSLRGEARDLALRNHSYASFRDRVADLLETELAQRLVTVGSAAEPRLDRHGT